MSTPSIEIAPPPRPSAPPSTGTSRHSADTKVVFPEPVRPTIPTLARGSISQLTSERASGSSGR